MASTIPKEVKLEIVTRWLPATEPVWKVALFLSTSNCLTQSDYSACTNQSSGTNYTAGGATLINRTVGYVDTTNAAIDAEDTSWASASFTARYAVVY